MCANNAYFGLDRYSLERTACGSVNKMLSSVFDSLQMEVHNDCTLLLNDASWIVVSFADSVVASYQPSFENYINFMEVYE
jgi:hypothetical protein